MLLILLRVNALQGSSGGPSSWAMGCEAADNYPEGNCVTLSASIPQDMGVMVIRPRRRGYRLKGYARNWAKAGVLHLLLLQ